MTELLFLGELHS